MGAVSPASAAWESAVLVPVPEAEPAVGRHRARLDRAAAQGVPAHVTILYPFVAPPEITAVTIEVLAAAVGSVSSFDCRFPGTAWFGEEVLWLTPVPDGPFRALIRAVMAAFPGYLPYGGLISDVIPHLTVGDRPPGGIADLRAAETDVLNALPVWTRVSRAWLMTGTREPGSWHAVAELPLAGS
jgi:2'-5' RNA ligase superfamily